MTLPELPVYVSVLFMTVTVLTLAFVYIASNYSRVCLWLALVWLSLHAILAYTGFMTVTNSVPPRAVIMIGPPILGIILLFTTTWGQRFIDTFNPTTLTWLHIVRIPVEIGLYFLAVGNAIPDVMTFEGRNMDIIAGLTAPLIAFYGMKRRRIPRNAMLIWNFLCLGLLFNVVLHGLLSIPSVIQQFEYEVPNIGLLYFPYTWLPSFIVPVVLFAHLVSIRSLIKKSTQ